jgi:hypothetical protein
VEVGGGHAHGVGLDEWRQPGGGVDQPPQGDEPVSPELPSCFLVVFGVVDLLDDQDRGRVEYTDGGLAQRGPVA